MVLRTTKSGFTKILQGFILVLLFAILPLLVILPQSAKAEGPEANESDVEYWAVIVGVSDYSCDSLDIGNISDAQDLYGELAPIWGEDHVKLLVDEEATKGNISDAICEWLDERADFNDIVFFYFSGHGNNDDLAPYDGFCHVSQRDISADELQEWLDELESSNIVVVLDSCYSGSFIPDLSKPGRIILTSSKVGQKSWYIRDLGHLMFTNYILSAIEDFPLVDSDEDNEVSVEEIFAYAEPLVFETMDSWEKTQNPQIDDKYEGDLELFYEATLYINPKDAALTADIDGVTYLAKNFPKTFRWAPNSSHSFVINSTDTAWVSSSPMNISQGGEHNFVYLDIESEYGDPQGEGWYEEGTTVNVSIASPLGVIVRDAFTGWNGDINGSIPQTTVYMNGPKSIVANWHKDYSQLYILIAGVITGVIVIAALGGFFLVKRRRKIRLMITPIDVIPTAVQQDESTTPK